MSGRVLRNLRGQTYFRLSLTTIRATHLGAILVLALVTISSVAVASPRGLHRVALVYQPDALGDAIKTAAVAAMIKTGLFHPAEHKMPFVAELVNPRNSDDVGPILDSLEKANPEAVIVGVNPANAARLIERAVAGKKHWLFLATSMAGSLPTELADVKEEVDLLISQVLPNPDSIALPVVREFHDDMKKIAAEKMIGYVAFEGYLGARVAAEAADRAGGGAGLTRRGFVASLEAKPFELGGFSVHWSAENHNGTDRIYLTRYRGGKLVDEGL